MLFSLIYFCFSYVHQNGSILRKYTYLSNDSSYSVSFEDGVDILLLDSPSDVEKESLNQMHETSESRSFSSLSQCSPDQIPSFTFETQVRNLGMKIFIFYF